jgi:predicted Rossmann fold flavoprotein
VKLKTEADGRMFSITDSSQTIIDCFLKEANKYGVEIMMNRDVKKIEVLSPTLETLGEENKFKLQFSNLDSLDADFVCVACGGYPKSSMFEWLTSLGHTIETPVPSLFTFNMPGNTITSLMGVSVENAVVKVVGTKLSDGGPLLITHWGLSGPAILKLSAWGARELADNEYRFKILINWVPQYNEQSLRDVWQQKRNELSATKISNRNPFGLPNRLWVYLLQQSDIKEEIRWADLPGKEQNKLIKNLTAQEFDISGKTTFKEEFVTCGGIKLTEVDVNTMESKIIPNLFFAGEILDVDGVTGGFNFQHAWTSGWIAAQAVNASLQRNIPVNS